GRHLAVPVARRGHRALFGPGGDGRRPAGRGHRSDRTGAAGAPGPAVAFRAGAQPARARPGTAPAAPAAGGGTGAAPGRVRLRAARRAAVDPARRRRTRPARAAPDRTRPAHPDRGPHRAAHRGRVRQPRGGGRTAHQPPYRGEPPQPDLRQAGYRFARRPGATGDVGNPTHHTAVAVAPGVCAGTPPGLTHAVPGRVAATALTPVRAHSFRASRRTGGCRTEAPPLPGPAGPARCSATPFTQEALRCEPPTDPCCPS